MKRFQLGFAVGAIITILGVLLAFNAHDLATDWQSLGPNAWGGTTDPDKSHLYQTFGFLMVGFGLFITGSTFYKWISHPRTFSPEARLQL